jgi:hypothetical protein
MIAGPPLPKAKLRGSFSYDAGMRVLLVEDDPGVQRFVVRGLREQTYLLMRQPPAKTPSTKPTSTPTTSSFSRRHDPRHGRFSRLPESRKGGHRITFGVLTLTLRSRDYDWQLIPKPEKSFTDSGNGACH